MQGHLRKRGKRSWAIVLDLGRDADAAPGFSSALPDRISFWNNKIWPTVMITYHPWKVADDEWWTPYPQEFEPKRRSWTKEDEKFLDDGQLSSGF